MEHEKNSEENEEHQWKTLENEREPVQNEKPKQTPAERRASEQMIHRSNEKPYVCASSCNCGGKTSGAVSLQLVLSWYKD